MSIDARTGSAIRTDGMSNQTLAAKLKKIGFSRGVVDWEKSLFTKSIHSKAPGRGRVIVTVRINSTVFIEQPNGRDAWHVVEINLETVNDGFEWKSGKIELDVDMIAELNRTLFAVESLR